MSSITKPKKQDLEKQLEFLNIEINKKKTALDDFCSEYDNKKNEVEFSLKIVEERLNFLTKEKATKENEVKNRVSLINTKNDKLKELSEVEKEIIVSSDIADKRLQEAKDKTTNEVNKLSNLKNEIENKNTIIEERDKAVSKKEVLLNEAMEKNNIKEIELNIFDSELLEKEKMLNNEIDKNNIDKINNTKMAKELKDLIGKQNKESILTGNNILFANKEMQKAKIEREEARYKMREANDLYKTNYDELIEVRKRNDDLTARESKYLIKIAELDNKEQLIKIKEKKIKLSLLEK